MGIAHFLPGAKLTPFFYGQFTLNNKADDEIL